MDSNPFRVCLGVYAGGGGLEKKEEAEGIEDFGRGGFGGFIFLHKTISPNLKELKKSI